MLGSRAVRRQTKQLNGDYWPHCPHCDKPVKFLAEASLRSPKYAGLTRYQIICNVFVREVWDRVEHYHEACYKSAGEPHGPLITGQEKPA